MNKDLTLSVAAQLLHYPYDRTAEQARAAAEWLEVVAPDAAAHARRFADEAEDLSVGALEEAYTAAFDFGSVGTLFAGEHLFGPSEARASLLARLRHLQREHGVEPGAELPDHLVELLRLAAAMPPGDERDELLADAFLPTARAALAPLVSARHPYAAVLEALVALVERFAPARAALTPAEPAAARRSKGGLAVVDDPEDLLEPSAEAAP